MNRELMEKARQVKSPEELLALAKENDIELSAEQAKAHFERLNGSEELEDDELDNVAGGCGEEVPSCPHCGSTNVSIGAPTRGSVKICNTCGNIF